MAHHAIRFVTNMAMTNTVKQFTVLDGQGHSMPVGGYQQANQLASKYLEHGDVAVIVIRVTKDNGNG